MGLVEILLAQLLYLNLTSVIDDETNASSIAISTAPMDASREKTLLFQQLESELKGMHLKIATVQDDALSYAVKIDNEWVGKGVAFDFIELLQDKFEFEYSVIVPQENELGSDTSGIFGLLHNNEVDMGAAFLPMTTTYWKYAVFATTLDVGEWVIVLKRHQEHSDGAGLMQPFNFNVWFLILISVIAVGPIMYLIVSLRTGIIFTNFKEKPISLVDCVWFVYGALFKQGTTLTPMTDSIRLAFATWWLFITILTAFYTANLTAFLTLSAYALPIKKPEDIATKKFPWAAMSGSVIEEASTNPQEELYYVLKDSPNEFVLGDSAEILQNWVTRKNYMYIADKTNVDILLYEDYLNKTNAGIPEPERCTYVVTPWPIFKRPRAFAYSKKFKFAPLFDATLRDLLEVGLVKYSLNKMAPNVNICPINLANNERQLRNTDLLLTYYIVIVGFSISIITFIVEIMTKSISQRKNIRKKRRVKFGTSPHFSAMPPSYEELFLNRFSGNRDPKRTINGREYWIIRSVRGHRCTLVPVQTSSAILYPYTD